MIFTCVFISTVGSVADGGMGLDRLPDWKLSNWKEEEDELLATIKTKRRSGILRGMSLRVVLLLAL
ncbi:Hypothetical predicted protein [Olea europaea subsp. europaea]|uniref:Uncharacterized protein n=1 Tax=Olea europaea subsp. europaea TaxID=158383 RepID=A0A8S0PIS4_OLEEU|nr:Hypothetical predicted protein [Olea europaea subsp. europaea]